MPIESRDNAAGRAADESLGAAYLAETREALKQTLRKTTHCVQQLADEDLWWRPYAAHNSIQNIVLHLCGNMRQWIIHGVGGAPDVRNRPQEFAERRPIAKSELLRILSDTVAQADSVLAACAPANLLEPRRIQGFETTVLGAIFDSVSHFVGHTHQIVYITRLRLGNAYVFQWSPGSAEEGAAPGIDG